MVFMNAVIAGFIDSLWQAALIWITLIVSATLALLGLLGRPRRVQVTPEQTARGRALKHARLLMRAQELENYAREVEVAAQRSADMAHRRREDWLNTQREAENTWQAYDHADREARKVILASYLPQPKCTSTPAEFAFRERYLHRAAMTACSHRQLSALELSDALAHRNGWNPMLHPLDQDVVLHRAVRECLFAGYRNAVARERDAWQDADAAAAAAARLHREAAVADEKARQARTAVRPARGRTSSRQLVQWGSRVLAH
jgi:hypothetical protein